MPSIPVVVTVDKVDSSIEQVLSKYMKVNYRWKGVNMYGGQVELQGNTPEERLRFYTKVVLDMIKEPCIRKVEKSVYLETLGD